MKQINTPLKHGYIVEKDQLKSRLRRIEGQVRGIENMVQDERYCVEILTQIAAAKTALETVAFRILDDHVQHCVTGALASGDVKESKDKTEELLDAIKLFTRRR